MADKRQKIKRRVTDAPPKQRQTRYLFARGRQAPPYCCPIFFLQSLDLDHRERFMRSMLAKAMAFVCFNYLEPNGFSPTQYVNFKPKCILGALAPRVDKNTKNRQSNRRKPSTKSKYLAIAEF